MTAAGPSDEKEVDKELVQNIIYKLKSQGCFDQFRKEFIADVDTKPAYKNLQQRVESYVSRFLSQQKWSPNLNKNSLRESLRRQINQSGMLNKGVERIVEQVVNPKIMQIIKPKVDEVTCDHLGLSLEARNSEIKRKQQEQQEKMMKSPDSAGIPNLLSLTFNSPPPGSNVNPFGTLYDPAVPPGGGSGLLPTPKVTFTPQIAANPYTNPAGLTFPGISQQQFPFLPPGWNASMSAGFPPVFPPGVPPFQNFTVPPPNAAITVPPPIAAGIALPPTSSPMVPSVSTTAVATRPSPGKGLNALLGLPTPSEEPPPPGTLVLPDGTHIQKKGVDGEEEETQERMLPQKFERIKTESESYESSEAETGVAAEPKHNVHVESSSESELPYIPLPEGYPSSVTKSSVDNQAVDDSRDLDFDTEDEKAENADGKRPYKFAWNEDVEADDDEVDESDVSSVHTSDVSSVHTSDLSNFEESDAEKEKAIEELENKLMLLQNEEGIGHVEVMAVEVASEDIETQVEEVEAADTTHVPEEETAVVPAEVLAPTPEPSPVKQVPVVELVPIAQQSPVPVPSQERAAKRPKPRKLLSLQYNYSDSDDEETREERKARIAREKEERYQKRLQRRAEMEAKRKEREEERVRQKKEKLEKVKEAVAEQVTEEVVGEVEAEKTAAANGEDVTKEEKDISEVDQADSDVLDKSADVSAEIDLDDIEETDPEKAVETEEEKLPEEITEKEAEQESEKKEEAEQPEKPEPPVDADLAEKAELPTPPADIVEAKDHDTSTTAAETSMVTESSGAADTSLAEVSSPEKKGAKPRKKTKAELKAELKEQKVQARKSARQRVRNKRYMSDDFVFKSPPDSSLSQSYDETMLVEETVEMEIDTEPHTIELDSNQVHLMEIPLPAEGDGHQQITMETVDLTGYTISQEGGEVLTVVSGETYVTTDSTGEVDAQQFVEVVPSSEFEVAQEESTSTSEHRPSTRLRSREDIRSGTSSVSDQSEDRIGSQHENKKKRKRNVSQSSGGGEPGSKKASPGQAEKRQLRSSDIKTDRSDGRHPSSKQSYDSEDLYKPRHSYSRRALSPPPLPSEPPPPPSDLSPPPLPPSPPPTDTTAPPPPPDSPPREPKSPDRGRRSRRKRKSRSRSRSRSQKRHKRSRADSQPRSPSPESISSASKKSRRSSSDSKSSYSRKRSKSRSLSSISSDSRHSRSVSRSRSRSYSKSRSYSRSRSRTRSSSRSRSRSRSVSRSRSRSISSISSKRSSFSKASDLSAEERRRKARPLTDVDFGEAAKRARHEALISPFGPRGPMGPMGYMGPGGHIPHRGMGAYPMRGMAPMARGSRGMFRGRYPSPHHMAPEAPPTRPTTHSPSKPYYPPGGGGPRYMAPAGPAWDDMHGTRSRPMYGDDDYYPPEDLHEGPGKTGITKRGTLYREDTSPSPPPERRPPPVYTPPKYKREGSNSPPIPTGITERGTLYREDTSPSPPPLRRRREPSSPPPPQIRGRVHPSTPSPPPMPRRRTISNRSGSFESISPSPSPPLPPLPPQPAMKPKRKLRPPSPEQRMMRPPSPEQRMMRPPSPEQRMMRPPSPEQRKLRPPSPEQRNTPPVLRRSRGPPVSTPSPPSSGELTPSPPDLSHTRGGASPVSPVPMYPASPRGPASPLESFSPSPRSDRDRLEPVSPPSPMSPPRLRRGHAPEPASPGYSPEAEVPPRLRRSSRNISSEEEVHYTRSRGGRPPSPQSPPPLPRSHRSMSPMPVMETRPPREKRSKGKSKKHKRR